MYRRYYKYNDPTPGQRRIPPQPPAPPPKPQPPLPAIAQDFLSGMAKDDLILAGLLLLLLLGEEKENIDLPLAASLLYLLLKK